MPTIKDILQIERNRDRSRLVLFLEGKFWKAYEHSAYVLTQYYNFKPTKKYIKSIDDEVISVGFPKEQLAKYLNNVDFENDEKMCRTNMPCSHDIQAFMEWKATTHLKENTVTTKKELFVPEEWKTKNKVFQEENLPVFKLVYDLLLRLFGETKKMTKDYRYSIGEDLKSNLLRTEVCIYHANEEKETAEKIAYITEAIDKLLEVKLFVRILHDSKQLSLQKYALLCEQMVIVERHLKNWKLYNLKHIKNEVSVL